MRGPTVEVHASDRGEISKPTAAFAARDGRSTHVGPSSRNLVQRADGRESRGAGGKRVARSVRGHGSGGHRSLKPRSQGGLFRGELGAGSGRDPRQSGKPG